MNIVRPDDKTTLLLSKYLEPINICTAKAAFKHLVAGRVVGIDAADNIYSWDGKFHDMPKLDEGEVAQQSSINWQSVNIELFPDHPALRAASKTYAVPTIIRCNRRFGYRSKNGKDISLRRCYEIYNKTCQYCFETIPYSEATKEHHYPRCRGGTDNEFNIVLACRKCNNTKDDKFPYFDKNGDEVKPRRPLPSGVFLPNDNLIRPEWKKYL